MKLNISTNIKKIRKEHGMTQEQLAEALDVTFAAVSKWERGVSLPELSLLVKMADLFGVSVDAIIGYQVSDRRIARIEKKIYDLQLQKRYDEAIAESKKALLQYPNDFRIVYRSGQLYAFAGIEKQVSEYIRQGIALLKQSILLISQNKDNDISESTIQYRIAQCYIAIGQYSKGIEILKRYNTTGVYSSLIAFTYSSNDDLDYKQAQPYMIEALCHDINTVIDTMMAYANYYYKIDDYTSSKNSLLWLIDFLISMKRDKNAVAYVDKVVAACYAECAHIASVIDNKVEMRSFLNKAYQYAVVFDSEPKYSLGNIKFNLCEEEKLYFYDDFGKTAMESVENQIISEECKDILHREWKKIKSTR